MSADDFMEKHGAALVISSERAGRIADVLHGAGLWAEQVANEADDKRAANALVATLALCHELAEQVAADLGKPALVAECELARLAKAEA